MKVFLFTLAIIFTASACHWCEDNPTPTTDCDDTCIIDADLYNNDLGNYIFIIETNIEDDCLSITYSSSGCSADGWIVDLYDSEAIAESLPPQRSLRLNVSNTGECAAVFTNTTSFDISNLQVEGNSSCLLNLQGVDEAILYNY